MNKVTTSSKKIQALGGLNFIAKEFNDSPILSLSESLFPKKQSKYYFSEVLQTLWLSMLSGGSCLEDTHQLSNLFYHPKLRLCSPDTVAKRLKNISVENIVMKSSSKQYEINTHPLLNRLLIDATVKLGLIDKNSPELCLDLDGHLIDCQKQDTAICYKKTESYQPNVAFIGDKTVGIEMRSGNCPTAFNQISLLEKCRRNLERHQRVLTQFRADAASFQYEVFEWNIKNNSKYYIRAKDIQGIALEKSMAGELEWRATRIGAEGYREVEVASFDHPITKGDKQIINRIAVFREKRKDSDVQPSLIPALDYSYWGIATNDKEMSEEEVIAFYNQRGTIEKNFDMLNNDFNWQALPFSYMQENIVFLLLSALCANFFIYLKTIALAHLPQVDSSGRLKKFIYNFVLMPAQWIKRARGYTLKLFVDKHTVIPLRC